MLKSGIYKNRTIVSSRNLPKGHLNQSHDSSIRNIIRNLNTNNSNRNMPNAYGGMVDASRENLDRTLNNRYSGNTQ